MSYFDFNDIYKQIDGIVNWMEDYIENSGGGGYVIGLSGGVDSSVVAALAVRALGKDNVHGLIMPIESDEADKEDAILVANTLGIKYDVVDLTDAFHGMMNAYPYSMVKDELVFLANIKARLRMAMLYGYAGEWNYLVAGTGNRSEDLIGYFTKYGDGAADILPIGEFYKWEIRGMAKVLGLSDKIADRVSTAGLWKGQTDEEELGITYKVLDNILMFYDGKIDSLSDEAKDKVDYVKGLIVKNKHKRKYPPMYKR